MHSLSFDRPGRFRPGNLHTSIAAAYRCPGSMITTRFEVPALLARTAARSGGGAG
ncbi:hypothetical protein OHA37_01120 [Streptomyces sp. NBC_00335]|uniref:hypothetical protein n=1 Tax=unclassified Streptomyces TaxID=2593676 RepID=UPI00225B7561|nr:MULTISPECIES: hypothetical protein [unclassified Streptomyces]MCX5402486.1 hypothetical protein [Streptomyces sp. NBC_00086]